MNKATFSWNNLKDFLLRPSTVALVMEIVIAVTLFAVVVGERTIVASQRRLMEAGDVFNFQSIARNIRHFDYPLKEKRLPGFPLALLVGTELGFDPTRTGIAISIISSAGTTVVLYLLGRHFKFPAIPLAMCLLLTAVIPLLTINGVRPLSDSYFMFLIVLSVYLTTVAKPTRNWAIAVGLVYALMSFTRYEGVPMALLLLALLKLRMSWKLLGIAFLPLLITGLLWLPVAKKVHGSFSNFGYAQDASEIASVKTLPTDYMKIVRSAGFQEGWAIADLWSDDEQLQLEAKDKFSSPGWWLSILATFGVVWLIVSLRKEALPVLVAFAFYPVLPAWWFTYSRYVAPMSAFYVFCMAAGVIGVWSLISRFLKDTHSMLRFATAALLMILLARAVFDVSPVLYKQAVNISLENNGKGYSLYQALNYLRNRHERVVVSFDYLMGYMMFGTVSSPKDGLNAGRGLYLSNKPEATPEEWVAYMKENDMEILIDAGEKELVPLVQYLERHGEIERTQTFEWLKRDQEMDITRLHYLSWK